MHALECLRIFMLRLNFLLIIFQVVTILVGETKSYSVCIHCKVKLGREAVDAEKQFTYSSHSLWLICPWHGVLALSIRSPKLIIQSIIAQLKVTLELGR